MCTAHLTPKSVVSAVGLLGSVAFLPLMLYYLFTNEPAVSGAVVLISVAVVGIELVYFERRSIEDGIRTIEKRI